MPWAQISDRIILSCALGGPASSSVLGEVTGGKVAASQIAQFGRFAPATRLGHGAARVKGAARWRMDGRRHIT